jgi:hypothetical protein
MPPMNHLKLCCKVIKIDDIADLIIRHCCSDETLKQLKVTQKRNCHSGEAICCPRSLFSFSVPMDHIKYLKSLKHINLGTDSLMNHSENV